MDWGAHLPSHLVPGLAFPWGRSQLKDRRPPGPPWTPRLGAILRGYKHHAEHLCAPDDVWFLDHSSRRGSQTPDSTIKASSPKLLSKKTQTLETLINHGGAGALEGSKVTLAPGVRRVGRWPGKLGSLPRWPAHRSARGGAGHSSLPPHVHTVSSPASRARVCGAVSPRHPHGRLTPGTQKDKGLPGPLLCDCTSSRGSRERAREGNIHSVCVCKPRTCVRLCATPRTITHLAPLSVGLSRQEYGSGSPCPPPGDPPDPGIEPTCLKSPALTGRFFTTSAAWEALLWVCLQICLLWLSPSPQGLILAPREGRQLW